MKIALLAAVAALAVPATAHTQSDPEPMPDLPPIVVPADMPLSTFLERGLPLRRAINAARYADCRPRHEWRRRLADVAGDRRAEHLAYLRDWRSRARARPHACTPRDLGKRLAARRGWTGGQWADLEELWEHESGWNPTAVNPRSGACGIPQAISCPYPLGRARAIVVRQIRWGLNYIAGRYRYPSRALDHFYDRNWY